MSPGMSRDKYESRQLEGYNVPDHTYYYNWLEWRNKQVLCQLMVRFCSITVSPFPSCITGSTQGTLSQCEIFLHFFMACTILSGETANYCKLSLFHRSNSYSGITGLF